MEGKTIHKVTVTYMDGEVEEYETPSEMKINGPMLLIDLGEANMVAINLQQVRKWEVRASRLQIARGTAEPTPQRSVQ